VGTNGEQHVRIELTQGYSAEIDFSDWWKVQGYTWRAHIVPKTVYAVTRIRDRGNVYMHRLIKPSPEGLQIDHEDGDGLNNRYVNLRHATSKQNSANAYRAHNATGYIGVSAAPSGRWTARVKKDGTLRGLGTFDTAEEAARVRDAWVLAEYGEFAILNFPVEDKP
jgi:hypothetical protein